MIKTDARDAMEALDETIESFKIHGFERYYKYLMEIRDTMLIMFEAEINDNHSMENILKQAVNYYKFQNYRPRDFVTPLGIEEKIINGDIEWF